MAATKEEQGGRTGPVKAGGELYNLADKGDTDQGIVNTFIESIFGIETGFQGTMISQFAKVCLSEYGCCDTSNWSRHD